MRTNLDPRGIAGAHVPDLPIGNGSLLGRRVFATYRTGVRESRIPTRQGHPGRLQLRRRLVHHPRHRPDHARTPAPLRTSALLTAACGDLDQQSGLKAILALEAANNCSCCASQVCGCDDPGKDIDAATQTLIGELKAAQEKLGITPQCEINGTLCGKDEL